MYVCASVHTGVSMSVQPCAYVEISSCFLDIGSLTKVGVCHLWALAIHLALAFP